MIGLGKVWNAVRGADNRATRDHPPPSTIPRAITMAKPSVPVSAWDPSEIVPSETRNADRFVPHRSGTLLTTTTGKRIVARIINISQTGVALEADLSEFAPQDIAAVGSRPVVPGRRIALGMVFLFKKPIDPKLCGPDIIL